MQIQVGVGNGEPGKVIGLVHRLTGNCWIFRSSKRLVNNSEDSTKLGSQYPTKKGLNRDNHYIIKIKLNVNITFFKHYNE